MPKAEVVWLVLNYEHYVWHNWKLAAQDSEDIIPDHLLQMFLKHSFRKLIKLFKQLTAATLQATVISWTEEKNKKLEKKNVVLARLDCIVSAQLYRLCY